MHKTAYGEEMYVCEMDDAHLRNTISLLLKNLDVCKKAIAESDVQTVNSVLYGRRVMNKKTAEKGIRSITEVLPAYVFEAAIRGISYTEELRKAFDREGKISFQGQALIQASNDVDPYDDCLYCDRYADQA